MIIAITTGLLVFIFACEFALLINLGRPFKDYRNNKASIMRDLEGRVEHGGTLLFTDIGYVDLMPVPSLFGRYYVGICLNLYWPYPRCVRIPWFSDAHKKIKQLKKARYQCN